jgi:hypothetical protein
MRSDPFFPNVYAYTDFTESPGKQDGYSKIMANRKPEKPKESKAKKSKEAISDIIKKSLLSK